MIPSSHDIKYFVEVASTLNMSRAAERLGISQPSLSLAVQRLEHSLGTQVLVRSKKGVDLTQAGRQLLAQSRVLIQNWELIRARTLASVNEIEGSYVIGCHPAVALYSLPLFLPDLLEKYPGLEIKLEHNLSRKIVESVVKMDVDLGIVVNPVKHEDLIIRKLCTDQVSLWVAKGKRTIQDFKSGEAVLIGDPELLQVQDLLRSLKKKGMKYKRLLPSSSLEVIAHLTLSGAGIGLLPGRVAAAAAVQGTLQRVSGAPSFEDEISLVYRVENKNVRSIQLLVETISKVLY